MAGIASAVVAPDLAEPERSTSVSVSILLQ